MIIYYDLGEVEPLFIDVDCIEHICKHFTPHVYVKMLKKWPTSKRLSFPMTALNLDFY